MNLLNMLRDARQTSSNTRHISADDRKGRRRRQPSLDRLEERQVLSTVMPASEAFLSVAPRAVSLSTATPAAAQSGTSLGLAWRFAPDATGGGTLYVQDVAKGTDTSDPQNVPIAINQSFGRMIFDTDINNPSLGPTFHSGSQVKVILGEHTGDINVYDDRNAGTGGLTTEDRLESGTITVADDRFLTYTLSRNVVTQQATFTITSGKTDKATYFIAPHYLNLSPGDPGYNPNSNPIVGLDVSDSQGNSGGVTFDQGTNVSIITQGGATFKNSSPFTVTKG